MIHKHSAILSSSLLLLSLVINGCVPKQIGPHLGDNRAPASVGTVSVSAPHFSPLKGFEKEDKRQLNFSKFNDEAAIATAISRISMRRDKSTALLSDIQVAVDYMAIQKYLDSTKTKTATTADGKTSSSESSETKETAKKAPVEVPDPAVQLALDQALKERLYSLLGTTDTEYAFPPDQMASLIASYKMYMFALERLYGLQDLILVQELTPDYEPYLIQFDASASPGWYTKHWQHDAEIAVKFNEDVHVVTAVPSQAVESLRNFESAFEQYRTAIALTAQQGPIGASAGYNRLQAAAERLEGLESVSTFMIGYGSKRNMAVLRFSPSHVPNANRREMDHRQQHITLLALVNNKLANERATAIADLANALGKLVKSIEAPVWDAEKVKASFAEVRVTLSQMPPDVDTGKWFGSGIGTFGQNQRPLLEWMASADVKNPDVAPTALEEIKKSLADVKRIAYHVTVKAKEAASPTKPYSWRGYYLPRTLATSSTDNGPVQYEVLPAWAVSESDGAYVKSSFDVCKDVVVVPAHPQAKAEKPEKLRISGSFGEFVSSAKGAGSSFIANILVSGIPEGGKIKSIKSAFIKDFSDAQNVIIYDSGAFVFGSLLSEAYGLETTSLPVSVTVTIGANEVNLGAVVVLAKAKTTPATAPKPPSITLTGEGIEAVDLPLGSLPPELLKSIIGEKMRVILGAPVEKEKK